MAVPILSYTEIAARADSVFRSHNSNQTIPLDIEHILDVEYGLEIYPRSGLMDRFQIDAFISADLKEIVVDKRVYDQKPPNRYRFSLAHEFAHLILHADVYRSLVFKTPEQWKETMIAIAKDDYDWLEWQANAFAGLLLIHPQQIRQHQLIHPSPLSRQRVLGRQLLTRAGFEPHRRPILRPATTCIGQHASVLRLMCQLQPGGPLVISVRFFSRESFAAAAMMAD